jgi:hypothetical protein
VVEIPEGDRSLRKTGHETVPDPGVTVPAMDKNNWERFTGHYNSIGIHIRNVLRSGFLVALIISSGKGNGSTFFLFDFH